jgi:6-phosphogluconolactonase
MNPIMADDLLVYIGTYTKDKGEGIFVYRMNAESGALTRVGAGSGVQNPSFLALHPNKKFLYSVSEVGGGQVAAFALDAKTGLPTLLNEQSAKGGGPCHVTVDRNGKNLLVANYNTGSIADLPISSDGRLQAATSAIQHAGHSVNAQRQEGPHAHSINIDPSGKYALVADLGLDKVLVYRFDAGKGMLTANTPEGASVKPGSGPRHFAFHPNGRYGYVINEMGNTVTAFRWDSGKGVLTEIQNISTLPDGFNGTSHTAEVVVHPSGKFLYGSNRGHDSISIFAVTPESGMLRLIGHQPTQGKTPRNFNIDPSGKFLIAANQDTNNMVVFRINPSSGSLTPTGQTIEAPKPVCIRFLTV